MIKAITNLNKYLDVRVCILLAAVIIYYGLHGVQKEIDWLYKLDYSTDLQDINTTLDYMADEIRQND